MSDTDPRSDDEQRKLADESSTVDPAVENELSYSIADPDDTIAVVNDNVDEPHNPDDQTVAETSAAQAALWSSRPVQKQRGPKSLVILLLVLLGVIGLGVYAVWWSNRLFEKNEMIELRQLEERVVMADWQKKYMSIRFPQGGVAPAGVVYKPLGPEEKARYDALMAKYKDRREPFEPNENEKLLINETKKLMGTN